MSLDRSNGVCGPAFDLTALLRLPHQHRNVCMFCGPPRLGWMGGGAGGRINMDLVQGPSYVHKHSSSRRSSSSTEGCSAIGFRGWWGGCYACASSTCYILG